jgi:hypothetical protein
MTDKNIIQERTLLFVETLMQMDEATLLCQFMRMNKRRLMECGGLVGI